MVFGWRRAFCTSVPRETDSDSSVKNTRNDHDSKKGNGGRFVFFSSSSSSTPSTPRLRPNTDSSPSLRCRTSNVQEKSASVPVSPKLSCKTKNSPKLFHWSSTPSSPRSPSTFSLLKSNIRFSSNRCGLCSQSVKRGRGVAIFTAECSHSFHFPCIAGYVKEKGSLACPICGAMRKETPILSVNAQNQKQQLTEEEATLIDDVNNKRNKFKKQYSFRPDLKVYNDDEPLGSLTPKARFIPIPESDENSDDDSIVEFQGFHIDRNSNRNNNSITNMLERDVDVRLLPEAAMISAGRGYETHGIMMKVKAPVQRLNSQSRAPIDLVTVVDVSGKMTNEKLQIMKRMMRMIISSLSSSDRLSIVAFSSYSKRLLPLKRMTVSGQRAARRIVEAMAVLDGSSNANDAVKKAMKVLEDRTERNTVASIFLLSDVSDQSSCVSSTRHLHNFPVHTLKLAAIDDHAFSKSVANLLNITVQDLKLELGFVSGSSPVEITAVYSHAPRLLSFGSGTIRIGEMVANEERELLIELKVPSTALRVHQVLSVRCSYRESVTHKLINCKEHALVVPRPHTVRSSTPTIQRLRSLFIAARSLSESRLLMARNELTSAYHVLVSARAVIQTNSAGSEFVAGIEAELNELQRKRQAQALAGRARAENAVSVDEKDEPLTPISAWRVAEKLAKVAIMRKTLNRVSDLHGFEDARF